MEKNTKKILLIFLQIKKKLFC